MIQQASPMSLADLCQKIFKKSGDLLNSAITQDGGSLEIKGISPLEAAGANDVAFLANPKYREAAKECKAGALVLTKADIEAMWGEEDPKRVLVVCDNPYAWFALALQVLYPEARPKPCIHPSAVIDPNASVGEGCTIESGVVIKAGAKIGKNVYIEANTVISEGVQIGDETHIYPRVTVYYGCRVGQRCVLHSGCVIGADGFGFAPYKNVYFKIPQVGCVVIGNDVEIGANTCIDRGALENTVIGDGTKIDDLVMIGHNCKVGKNCVLSGRTGLAGSTIIGDNCQCGGGSGFAGHLSIPAGTIIGGGAGVPGTIDKPGYYAGYIPAMPHREFFNILSVLKKLPEMRRQLKRVEAQLKTTEK